MMHVSSKIDITSSHAGRLWIERLLGRGYGPPGPKEYDDSSLDKFEIHFGYGTSRMLKPKKFKHAERKYVIDVFMPGAVASMSAAVLTLPSISRDIKTGCWRVADCWKDVAVTWSDDICNAFFALASLADGEDLAGAYSMENKQNGAYMVSARRLESNRSVVSIGVRQRFELASEAEVTIFHAAEFIFRWLIETKQLKRNRGAQEVQAHYYQANLVKKFRDYVYRTAPITAMLNQER